MQDMSFGNVEFIEDVSEKCNALALLMKQQANVSCSFTEAQAGSVCVFKVKTINFIGKRKPYQIK